MGNLYPPPEIVNPCAFAFVVLSIWFFFRFSQEILKVGALKTLPQRRKQYSKIATYSFVAAPLAFLLGLVPVFLLFPNISFPYTVFIGFAFIPVFVLYGLINLSRARDVQKLERYYAGEDIPRT